MVEVPDSFVPLENYGTINAMRGEVLGPGDEHTLQTLVNRRARALSAGEAMEEGVPLLFRNQYVQSDVLVLAHELELGQPPGTSLTWTEEAYTLRDGQMVRVIQTLSEDEEAEPRAQMLDLAGKIAPLSREVLPEGPGACLPTAITEGPPTSEVHGMTFVPRDADGAPVGLEISITSRSSQDPALDPDMPTGDTARPIMIAGLDGVLVDDPNRFGPSKLAVAMRPATGATPALRIQIYYYDERSEPGASPYTDTFAQTVWDHVIATFRERSAPE